MDAKKLEEHLSHWRNILLELKEKPTSQVEFEVMAIRRELLMVIRRVYPNPEYVIGQLFTAVGVATNDPDERRKILMDDIKETALAIEIIRHEMAIFGLRDFAPVKEETETSVSLGGKLLGGSWRKKTSK